MTPPSSCANETARVELGLPLGGAGMKFERENMGSCSGIVDGNWNAAS
jgi:hypothetical protein